MNHADTPVYQTVIEKSRGLLFRSQAMASAIEVRAAGGAVSSEREQARYGGRTTGAGGRGGKGGNGPRGPKKDQSQQQQQQQKEGGAEADAPAPTTEA